MYLYNFPKYVLKSRCLYGKRKRHGSAIDIISKVTDDIKLGDKLGDTLDSEPC